MPDVDLVESGFFVTKIGDIEKRLDLYDCYNAIVAIQREHAEEVREQNAAVVKLLASHGFPDCSQRTAIAFISGVLRTVENLEKKAESAESPSPTAN
jgi:hypothetical protein